MGYIPSSHTTATQTFAVVVWDAKRRVAPCLPRRRTARPSTTSGLQQNPHHEKAEESCVKHHKPQTHECSQSSLTAGHSRLINTIKATFMHVVLILHICRFAACVLGHDVEDCGRREVALVYQAALRRLAKLRAPCLHFVASVWHSLGSSASNRSHEQRRSPTA